MNAEHFEHQNATQIREAIKTLIRADVDEGLIKFYDADAATIALASRVLDELCLELNYNPQRVKAESKGV
jgi:hypothetical protein